MDNMLKIELCRKQDSNERPCTENYKPVQT